MIYISWMLLAGYSRYAISTFFYAVAGAGAAAAFGFCVFLRCTHGYGRHVIAAIALCTFPPTAIGSLAAFSSQAPTHVGLHGPASRCIDLLTLTPCDIYFTEARPDDRAHHVRGGDGAHVNQEDGDLAPSPVRDAVAMEVRHVPGAECARASHPSPPPCQLSPPSPSSPAQAHAAFVLHMLEAISPFLLMGLAALADVDISLADNYAYVYARSQVTQTSFALA